MIDFDELWQIRSSRMTENIIDLHSHTIHSDGSSTPLEIVELAKLNGARAVAITDHDTIDGLREGRNAAGRLGVEFVNGIELSAEYSPGTMHILGYYIDDEHEQLAAKLQELRAARDRRNPEIAVRLEALGVDVRYDEVAELASNDVVGRPHFARVLVDKGYAASIQDAFDRFLAKGAAAYVEKKRLSPGESISLIHNAKGVAVLAHPYQLRLPAEALDRLVGELVELGLDGIEAIYSRHSPAERECYSKLADRHRLLVTGGSDYHGTYKPDISLVNGLGNLAVPYSLLEALRSKATHVR
ncbi:MAG: PHP domain-containing protein [Blastocatellia bacterium]